jgi:hypothetical protein
MGISIKMQSSLEGGEGEKKSQKIRVGPVDAFGRKLYDPRFPALEAVVNLAIGNWYLHVFRGISATFEIRIVVCGDPA